MTSIWSMVFLFIVIMVPARFYDDKFYCIHNSCALRLQPAFDNDTMMAIKKLATKT
ncbi:hypothetical protein HMPREF3224_02192 [Anaerococcus hydrogenalis]|nr:hypothetical protein HMPREF3224_02192 [Anaerococcus hydrogenalis]